MTDVTQTVKKSEDDPGGAVYVWEQDPGSGAQPTGGNAIQVPAPVLDAPPLALAIEGTAPPPAPYPQDTPEFRYWAGAAAVARTVAYWKPLLPAGTDWHSTVGPALRLTLDQGQEFNAYYDRAGLHFFHDSAGGRTVYSGESPDVVCHESGHAILDSIQPQLWDAAFSEAAAFHEAFADCSALLSGLQVPTLRQEVLSDTGGVLYRSSRLSRLAEQLGWAIRQSRPDAVEPDCLRNAVNSLFYQDPATLPPSGPASALSSEPHSFSRVFTGGFFEAVSGMFAAQASQDEATLAVVSRNAGGLLIQAVLNAPVVPNYFSQVAAHMADAAANADDKAAINSAFVRHGVLSLASATAVARAADAPARITAAERGAELPLAGLSLPEFGLRLPSLLVHAGPDPKRSGVAGAALGAGSVTPPANEEAARTFVSGLFLRGSVDLGEQGEQGVSVYHPLAHKTHVLVSDGDAVVLKRTRIDCGFGCRHRRRGDHD